MKQGDILRDEKGNVFYAASLYETDKNRYNTILIRVVGAEYHPKYPFCDVQRCKGHITHRCSHGWFCGRHQERCPDA